ESRFISAIAVLDTTQSGTSTTSREIERGASASLSAGPAPATAELHSTSRSAWAQQQETTASDILLRVFDPKALISNLKGMLERVGIRNLFVLVDDFSELPQSAMRVVVDVLLAPLNNWSDEFIKFKVAAYPGRIYFGSIDKTKID